MSKFGRRIKQPPPGYEYIEPTLTALDNELREKVNEPHEGLRKTESQWPVHQINWQRSRYIFDLYYTYNRISKELYDYCITNKIVDAALIAKWKKPGYERLCSTYTINQRNYKFGTVSICRVPKQFLPPNMEIEDPTTGCRGCASGSVGDGNIFGNKYGQYLAAIQVAREEREIAKDEHTKGDGEDDSEDDDEDEDDVGPVGAADGSSGKKKSIWAAEGEHVELTETMVGRLDPAAEREARLAMRSLGSKGGGDDGDGPKGKKSRLS